MESFKVIIVEDVKLELKGTEQIFHSEIPEAEIIGTAATETEFWKLMRAEVPQLVLLDLGLGTSTLSPTFTKASVMCRMPSFEPMSGCISVAQSRSTSYHLL